jgi:hypothetical protein
MSSWSTVTIEALKDSFQPRVKVLKMFITPGIFEQILIIRKGPNLQMRSLAAEVLCYNYWQ